MKIVRYSHNGQSTDVLTMKDAFTALAYAEDRVAQEDAINSGQNQKVLTRFRKPL